MHNDHGINKLNAAKRKWDLAGDGEIIRTRSSILQPVLYSGTKAMLKIALHPEEQHGNQLMACWDGVGAAKVLQFEGDVLLMERATGTKSLRQMVLNGDQD